MGMHGNFVSRAEQVIFMQNAVQNKMHAVAVVVVVLLIHTFEEGEELKMEGLQKNNQWLIIVVMVTMSVLCAHTESRSPVLHRVGGGKYTWKPNVNFTQWAEHQHFYVGDWLYFGFDKHKYNVLQVNKTNYEKCGDKDFIENVTRGGRDVFNLTEAKPFYFICGRGDYCSKGMRIAVHVETDPPPPAASPNLTISASPSPSSIHGRLLLTCTIAFLSIFCSVSL